MKKTALCLGLLMAWIGGTLGTVMLYGQHSIWSGSILLLIVGVFQFYTIQKFFQYFTYLDDKLRNYEQTFKQLGYNLSVASSQVFSVSKSLSLTLEENNAFTQELFSQTEEMSTLNKKESLTIQETLLSIKAVLSGLKQIEETTTQLQNLSDTSQGIIHESLSEVLEVLVTIQEMKASSSTTITSVKKLTGISQEILNLLGTVNAISDQTHLLALNASIESARAGEAGKGFAVVAEEIRKLSTSTSCAVKDVNTLIDSIQHALEGVNCEVLKNFQKVELGVLKSKHIEESLEKMKLSFGEVVTLVGTISELSKEEMLLVEKAGENINLVENSMEQTASSVENVSHSVSNQKTNMEEVAEMGVRLNQSAQLLSLLLKDYNLGDLSCLQTKGLEDALAHFKEMVNKLSKATAFVQLDTAFHRQALQDLKDTYPFIEAIWTNECHGRFIVSLPPAGIANASVREWFQKSIAGELYVSSPYISAITRMPCITLSAPICEGSGRICGVIGLDITLESNEGY
ncbi:chemotaxis protein [Sporanaerobium hydrogeniformans]|uniref:Chemotaxis protein n=1 Tax=Sporanaerobium hydrogeniformans TaxID=3072179 RepID=A0AC61DDC7_9FIRM|nr:methyl-accepting chemotaxis protein [Sporanaerobium hydrogeniformans]PHV70733.1 chemotaxis protein [Sporanaerobium hydrogeniformans]